MEAYDHAVEAGALLAKTWEVSHSLEDRRSGQIIAKKSQGKPRVADLRST